MERTTHRLGKKKVKSYLLRMESAIHLWLEFLECGNQDGKATAFRFANESVCEYKKLLGCAAWFSVETS